MSKRLVMRKGLSRDILSLLAEIERLSTTYIINPELMGRKYLFIFNNGKGQNEKDYKQSYYYLKRNGLIDVDSQRDQISISITKKGKQYIEKTSILQAAPLYEETWDGKWRIITFDIPYKYREKRNALRKLLKNIGFIQMHKSVWVNPYDCTKELEQLQKFLRFNAQEVRLIIATDIGEAGRFTRHFNLD